MTGGFSINIMGKEMDGLFADKAKGAVHSVFDSSLNIMLDNNRLITVLTSGRGLVPYSLGLAENIRLTCLGISPGDKAALDFRGLAAGRLAAGLTPRTVRVKLSPADLGSGAPDGLRKRLQILALTMDNPEARAGIVPILCAVEPGKIPFVMEQNVYTRFLAERVAALGGLFQNGDAAELGKAGAGLAGCGPGLTPSSDDFLCGFMAAIFGGGVTGLLPPLKAAGICKALAEGAAPRTGDIPAAFLKSAGEGLFSADLIALLRAFFTKPVEELAAAAKMLTEFGSTSGFDTLAGVWFGLNLLNPE